jgi:hypothetical protein
MFDAAHPRVAGFDSSDFERQVAKEGNILLFGFFSNCEKSIARWQRNDFYEIGAALFEVINSGAGFVRVVDGILLRRFLATRNEKGPGSNEMRSEEHTGFGFALPGKKNVQVAAHVTHAGDAVREQEWQKDLFAPRRIGVETRDVDVHVPKTRQQEFSGTIDGTCGFGHLDRRRSTDSGDVASFNQDGLIGLWRSAGGVDDRHVGYGEPCRRLLRRDRRNDEETHQQEEKNASRPQRNAHLPGNQVFLESYHKQRQPTGFFENRART